MPKAMWGVLGCSSKAPFVDQVAKAGLVSPGDFAHEILGQLQVALGTRPPDMAEIRREEWQLRIEVYILFAPQQKAKGRE